MTKRRLTDNGALSPSEDRLQAQIWKRLWNTYPQLRRLIWHVPNQGASLRDGVQLQAMGVLAGVWDLHMLWNGVFHIFELKVGNNQLTRDRVDKKGRKHFGQLEWGELMAKHGAVRHLCRSEDEFFKEIEKII